MRPRLLAWKIEGLLELFSEMGKWKKAEMGLGEGDQHLILNRLASLKYLWTLSCGDQLT